MPTDDDFPVDTIEEDNFIYVYAEIPGVNKENISIDFYNNSITIDINKPPLYNRLQNGEIRYGKFNRTITLPICVTKKETVAVTYNNGVLKIKINKLVEEENKFSMSVQ